MSVLYDLEWQLADETPVGSVSGVTTIDYYELSGLTACTTYEWRIRADDAGEKSDWSDWVSFQTELATSAATIAIAAPLPVISTDGVAVSVHSSAFTLVAPPPTISTGASVSITAIPLVVGYGTPTILTETVVFLPVNNLILEAPIPTIFVGACVELSVVPIAISAQTPAINTGVVLPVPNINVVVTAPCSYFIGQVPDGVDRPHALSATPRYRVSNAA